MATDRTSAPATAVPRRSRIARMNRAAPAVDTRVNPLSRRWDGAEVRDRCVGILLIFSLARDTAPHCDESVELHGGG